VDRGGGVVGVFVEFAEVGVDGVFGEVEEVGGGGAVAGGFGVDRVLSAEC
jgi:hypothetical protein